MRIIRGYKILCFYIGEWSCAIQWARSTSFSRGKWFSGWGRWREEDF